MSTLSTVHRAQLAFHGCVVLLIGLFSGIGFWYAAAISTEQSQLYKTWHFAHLEGLLNGIVVLAIAGVWVFIDDRSRAADIGRRTLLIGAYANAIGPLITALFIGHRVIHPHTPLEFFVVVFFYVPGVLPGVSTALFVWTAYQIRSKSLKGQSLKPTT